MPHAAVHRGVRTAHVLNPVDAGRELPGSLLGQDKNREPTTSCEEGGLEQTGLCQDRTWAETRVECYRKKPLWGKAGVWGGRTDGSCAFPPDGALRGTPSTAAPRSPATACTGPSGTGQ